MTCVRDLPRSLLLLTLTHQGIPLGSDSLLLALAGSLGLGALGVHLLLEGSLTGLLSLGTVDLFRESAIEGSWLSIAAGQTYVLNEGSLVLEGVTLAGVVELVVQVLVDLAGGAVLDEEAAEDTQAAHPEDLLGHTGVGGTLALTEATVTTVAAGQVELTGTGPRVHGDGLADDQAILDQLADGLAGVGVGDLADLVGVEPDLVLAAADDRGGQALLGSQVDPVGENQRSAT